MTERHNLLSNIWLLAIARMKAARVNGLRPALFYLHISARAFKIDSVRNTIHSPNVILCSQDSPVRDMSKKILAWGVHLYTASGLVAAAMMVVLIVRGGDEAFRSAFALMLLATFIDSTDGWMARRVRVKEVVPGFDGRRLDDIVDFHTYTTIPLLLIWRAGILEGGQEWWLLMPLLASAYGFSQVNAKTDDGFFLGFPSYWNIVAFYLYLLRPPIWLTLALVITLSLLTFVPWRYLYPSQRAP